MKSVVQVAEMLGRHRITISALCKKFGFRKIGKAYVLGDREIKILKVATSVPPGNPNWRKENL
jgi:hypothetical protein